MKKTISGMFHDKFVYSRRMQRLTELLSEFLCDSREVLDVGCGDGMIDSLIMKKLDIKIKGIDVLVRDKTYIPVYEYDGINIPVDDKGKPDTIMTIDVLHHTDDPALLLSVMTDRTKKYIIIKDHYCHGYLSYIKLRVMDYVGNAHYKVRLPYNYLSRKQWENLYEQNGLRIVKIQEKLNLYDGLLHLIFDKDLHFIVKLEKITNIDTK